MFLFLPSAGPWQAPVAVILLLLAASFFAEWRRGPPYGFRANLGPLIESGLPSAISFLLGLGGCKTVRSAKPGLSGVSIFQTKLKTSKIQVSGLSIFQSKKTNEIQISGLAPPRALACASLASRCPAPPPPLAVLRPLGAAREESCSLEGSLVEP